MMLVMGLAFTACSSDDDSASNSPLVGTWTMQIQWCDTDGTRDDSYTFNANGTGVRKWWEWLDQKYVYQNFTWSANETIITIEFEHSDSGYVSGMYYYTLTSNALTLYMGTGDLLGTYFKK